MEKLITFAVPSYNSEAYMRNCIESLLIGGEDVQIVIVNDGSKDGTAAIADEYARNYPTIVEAVHKENGGHGSGVNAGLAHAKGLYYKVVDSDDKVNADALQTVLAQIREHRSQGTLPDMYVTNYVYDKPSENTAFPRRYEKNFPIGRMFGWKEVKPFYISNVLLMHSMLVRTEVLRTSGLKLPEHTFYVDNIYAYQPLPHVHTMFYMDVDFYFYFIGREDQSVSHQNIVKRYKQQMGVTDIMMRCYRYAQFKSMPKNLKKYLKHDLSVLLCLTVMFTLGSKEDWAERKAALKGMWSRLKREDRKMYNFLRHRSYLMLINWMPCAWQGAITTWFYHFFSRTLKCS